MFESFSCFYCFIFPLQARFLRIDMVLKPFRVVTGVSQCYVIKANKSVLIDYRFLNSNVCMFQCVTYESKVLSKVFLRAGHSAEWFDHVEEDFSDIKSFACV